MILDTNALSAFVDGQVEVAQILREQTVVAIPVIVLGEFRYGISGSRYRESYEKWLDEHLEGFLMLPIQPEVSVEYAAIRVALKRSGRPIPANDAWIAALALHHRMPILSRDGHFDVIRGIERRSW